MDLSPLKLLERQFCYYITSVWPKQVFCLANNGRVVGHIGKDIVGLVVNVRAGKSVNTLPLQQM